MCATQNNRMRYKYLRCLFEVIDRWSYCEWRSRPNKTVVLSKSWEGTHCFATNKPAPHVRWWTFSCMYVVVACRCRVVLVWGEQSKHLNAHAAPRLPGGAFDFFCLHDRQTSGRTHKAIYLHWIDWSIGFAYCKQCWCHLQCAVFVVWCWWCCVSLLAAAVISIYYVVACESIPLPIGWPLSLDVWFGFLLSMAYDAHSSL